MTLKEMDKLQERIEALKKEKQDARHQYAKENSPFPLGAHIEIKGYSYTGKLMMVERVLVENSWGGWQWRFCGPVVKKDGTTSANYTSFSLPIEEEDI